MRVVRELMRFLLASLVQSLSVPPDDRGQQPFADVP